MSITKLIILDFKAYLPFSRVDFVSRAVDKCAESILDVGCGEGLPMKGIRGHRSLFSVGVDQSVDFIKSSRSQGIHDAYVLCSSRFLPFREKSFDVILCLESLYALPKDECFKVIAIYQKIGRKQIIISERLGADSEETDPWNCQIKSTWYISDFQKLGFTIRGSHGIKSSLVERLALKNGVLKYLFSYVTSLPAYFAPQIAANVLCAKKLDCRQLNSIA